MAGNIFYVRLQALEHCRVFLILIYKFVTESLVEYYKSPIRINKTQIKFLLEHGLTYLNF